MTALLVVFGVWLAVGVALNVRAEVRRAGQQGESRSLAAAMGVFLATPIEWGIVGLAVLVVLAWQAV